MGESNLWEFSSVLQVSWFKIFYFTVDWVGIDFKNTMRVEKIEIGVTLLITCVLFVFGMLVYSCLWIRDDWARTPMLSSKPPPSQDAQGNQQDTIHHSIFPFYQECIKILFSLEKYHAKFFKKYGIEQYFYFFIQILIFKALFVSFVSVIFTIFLYGVIFLPYDRYFLISILDRMLGGF